MAKIMNKLLTVSKVGNSVTLEIQGYESNETKNWNEDNWLSCKAQLYIGRWNFDFPFSCFTTDLSEFSKDMEALKDGVRNLTAFVPLEPDLQFEISYISSGEYRLILTSECKVRRDCEFNSSLSLALILTFEEVCLLADQAANCSAMFPQRGMRR